MGILGKSPVRDSDWAHSSRNRCSALSQASGFLFHGLVTFCTGMLLLCFCVFMTVYTEPSAFPSVNTQSSLQVQLTEASAPLQCTWLNAPGAGTGICFFILYPRNGIAFHCPPAPSSFLWAEHPLGHGPAWPGFQTCPEFCSTSWVCLPAQASNGERYTVTANFGWVCPRSDLKHLHPHLREARAFHCIISHSSGVNNPAVLLLQVQGIITLKFILWFPIIDEMCLW